MTTPDGLVAPTPTRERFVDSVPLGMCVLDERGCILQVSPGLLGSLGFRPEQLIGQAFGPLLPHGMRLALVRGHR